MKKIIGFLCLFLMLLVSCDNNDINSIIGLKEGDLRITVTENYIYVEKCSGFNFIGDVFWQYEKILNKDSTNYYIIKNEINLNK